MQVDSELKSRFIAAARRANTPAERKQLLNDWEKLLGKSRSTLKRWLAESLVPPTRISTGGRPNTTDVSDQVITSIMHQVQKGRRKTGDDNTPYEIALHLAEQRGIIKPGELSVSKFIYRVKKLGLLKKQILTVQPHIPRRSEFSNQLQQFDWSVCLQWDFGDRGRPLEFLSWTEQLEKNKIFEQVRRRKYTIWRALLVDHYSGSFFLKYYLITGESALNTLVFLQDAWMPHNNRALKFHGIPKILLTDKGPGNTALVMRNLCTAFGIQLRFHKTGVPRAKGAVERSHYLVQQHFESMLHAAPPADINELNRRAEDWQVQFNANRLHTRHHKTRFKFWADHLIYKGENMLRVPQSAEMFRNAASKPAGDFRVAHDGAISVDGCRYAIPRKLWESGVSRVHGILNPFYKDAVLVSVDKKTYYIAKKLFNNEAGFRADAASIVAARPAPVDYAESFRREAEIAQLPAAKISRMTADQKHAVDRQYPLPVPTLQSPIAAVVEPHIDLLDAKMKIFKQLHGISDELIADLKNELAAYPDGITATQLREFIVKYRSLIDQASGQTLSSAG